MGQFEITSFNVKEWIFDPYVNSLLDGPSGVVCLPDHYGEIIHTDAMPRGVTIVIDGGRGP